MTECISAVHFGKAVGMFQGGWVLMGSAELEQYEQAVCTREAGRAPGGAVGGERARMPMVLA